MVLEENAGNAGGKHLQRLARLALIPLERPEVINESRERRVRSIYRWLDCSIAQRQILHRRHFTRSASSSSRLAVFYNSWNTVSVKLAV